VKEIYGNMWDFYGRDNYIVCITTNGFVKKDGTAVMGRGSALEAKQRWPWFPKALGESIRKNGNVVRIFHTSGDETEGIIVFPVKHNWWEMGSLELIQKSAKDLEALAIGASDHIFILGRPGCNNGRLEWKDVKPLIEFLPDNVHVITRKVII
jgi:hypothetical protein